MVGRLRRMFAQPGFAVLVMVLGLAAINWPFLDLAREAGNMAFFGYFFGAWGLLVLLAFLISRSVVEQQEQDGDGDA